MPTLRGPIALGTTLEHRRLRGSYAATKLPTSCAASYLPDRWGRAEFNDVVAGRDRLHSDLRRGLEMIVLRNASKAWTDTQLVTVGAMPSDSSLDPVA
jgi:hypothetical protein